MPRHEVDSLDDIRPHTGTLTVEYTHTQQVRLLSHAESVTADDAGYVRTMPVAVNAAGLTLNRIVNG